MPCFTAARCVFSTNETCMDWYKRLSNALNPPRQLKEVFAFAFHAWCLDDSTSAALIDNCYHRGNQGQYRRTPWRHGNTLEFLALCEGNPPVTGRFPPQRASNVEVIVGAVSWLATAGTIHSQVHWCIMVYRCAMWCLPIGLIMNLFNTLRPRQNKRLFAEDIFRSILLNENVGISIEMSLKFVPRVQLTIFQHWFR